MNAVVHPDAAYYHGLTGRGIRETSDNGNRLAVSVAQAQDGVAVFLIFIYYRVYRAGKLQQFIFLFHSEPHPVSCKINVCRILQSCSSNGFKNWPV